VEPDVHDEIEIFTAIERCGARALLIGRRALVAYGLPVLTADYEFWIAIEDVERFNEALVSIEMAPNRTPDEARQRGRYVVENGDRIDVRVARSCPTVDGAVVSFEGVWERRVARPMSPHVSVWLPCLEDLILTKRFADRERDRVDIAMLEALRKTSEGEGST
jgi:hypothetical protein